VGSLPFDVAPWAALAALVLAVAPLLWAGAEKEIVEVTSTEMVDRTVPSTVTYVSMPGLAMTVGLAAPGSTEAPPYGVLVRDAPGADAFTIVATETAPADLLTRQVLARVTARNGSAAAAAFAARGESTAGLIPDLWLVEVPLVGDEPIEEVSEVTGLADLPANTPVEIELTFTGEAVPLCDLGGAGCADRSLATGAGVFVHLARGLGEATPVIVQTAYPSSVVPGRWMGTQVRNGQELEAFAASIPVHALAGWGRILTLVSIADDPTLSRDKLWLGPVVLAAFASILWLGGRIGYPVFRPVGRRSGRWRTPSGDAVPPTTDSPARDIPVRVSGHGLTVGGRRRTLDEVPAVLRSARASEGDTGRATAVLELPRGDQIAMSAFDTGSLGRLERGEDVYVRGARPALWAHWFGTDLRITFASDADRDLAADLVEGSGAPLGSVP
jgi:hypothetical protein